MKFSKSRIFVLLSICLAISAPITSTVTTRGTIQNGSIRKGDVMAIDFNTIFDFSRVKDMSTLKFSVNQFSGTSEKLKKLGTVYSGLDEPFFHYQYKKIDDKFAFTKYLDERSFIIITEQGKIIYEESSANGYPRNFKDPKIYQIETLGKKFACHDAITWGDNDSQLVIGCISRDTVSASSTIWI